MAQKVTGWICIHDWRPIIQQAGQWKVLLKRAKSGDRAGVIDLLNSLGLDEATINADGQKWVDGGLNHDSIPDWGDQQPFTWLVNGIMAGWDFR